MSELREFVRKVDKPFKYPELVELCSMTRSLWAAYLNSWTVAGAHARDNKVESVISACCGKMEKACTAFTGAKRGDVEHFLENMRLRSKLIQTLHAEGLDAAEREMECLLSGEPEFSLAAAR